VSARLAWAHGGAAEVIALTKDAITVRSTVPSPPGSRIEGALEGGGGTLKMKVHASKKQPDGAFLLEGRPLDMTREVRERVSSAIANSG
jgi:hypothetical protein